MNRKPVVSESSDDIRLESYLKTPHSSNFSNHINSNSARKVFHPNSIPNYDRDSGVAEQPVSVGGRLNGLATRTGTNKLADNIPPHPCDQVDNSNAKYDLNPSSHAIGGKYLSEVMLCL